MQDESSDAADLSELVTVHVATSDFEAQTIATVLRDGGVEAVVFGAALGAFGLTGSGSRLLGGVPVQVRAGDLERARGVLRANKYLADSVDWDRVDVGEEDDAARKLGTRGVFTTSGRWLAEAGRVSAIAALVFGVIVLLGQCT
ncbi:MAG: hypothetical protein FJ285_06205 [Planctomycetes bacterium]|nr:hypothetical protein [Planctomycetota bacterium]